MYFGSFIPGQVLRRFEEQGNFSDSYLAMDLNLEKEVAVKDINPKRVNGDAFTAFVSELRNLTTVNHARICPVLYAGQDVENGNLYRIVTKYYENGSLQKLIDETAENNATISMSHAVEILLYVCSALDNLHTEGIVHNDLKPSNILLDHSKLPVLTDFGQSATLFDPFVNAPRTYWKNLSPEHCTHGAISFCSDIYQFGLLAYRIFNSTSFNQQAIALAEADPELNRLKQAIQDESFPNRDDLPVFIPERLVEIIRKCLMVNIEDRYECVYDLQQDLAKVEAYDVVYNFDTNILSGTLNDRECQIHIDRNESRYDIRIRKNGRWERGQQLNNGTELQARRHILQNLRRLARA